MLLSRVKAALRAASSYPPWGRGSADAATVRRHRLGLRHQTEPDRVAGPIGVAGRPRAHGLARGVGLAYRAVAMEDELAALREFQLAAPVPTACAGRLRRAFAGATYALLVGGLAAGFGFLTFGGRFGVLSPMMCLRVRGSGAISLEDRCATAS